MIVLGVDPGKKTGWAAYDLDRLELTGAAEAPQDEFVDKIVPWLEASPAGSVTIACERFVITGGTIKKSRGDENWSIEQIGILRQTARRYGHGFKLQNANDAKKFATNDRLRLIGWYVPGRGHANDALRHVLLWLGDHRVDVLERVLTT